MMDVVVAESDLSDRGMGILSQLIALTVSVVSSLVSVIDDKAGPFRDDLTDFLVDCPGGSVMLADDDVAGREARN